MAKVQREGRRNLLSYGLLVIMLFALTEAGCKESVRFCDKKWKLDTTAIVCEYEEEGPLELSGLEKLEKLQLLQVWTKGGGVLDLSPIENLKNISKISLMNTPVREVETLSRFKKLEHLYLEYSSAKNYESLSKLTNMKRLTIGNYGNVLDVSFVRDMPNLESLYLRNVVVADLSPLRTLKKLKRLTLSKTSKNDFSPLGELDSLNYLCLHENRQLNDLGPISRLKNLEELRLDSATSVTDFLPLKNLRNLRKLDVSGCYYKLDQLKEITAINPKLEITGTYNKTIGGRPRQ